MNVIYYETNTGEKPIYDFIEDDTAVLTNGFVKKTMLTPRKEIELAKKYRKDFLERNKDEILHI